MSSRGEGAGVREAAERGELGSDLRLPFHQNEFLEQNPRPGIPGFPNRSGVGPSARGVLWV